MILYLDNLDNFAVLTFPTAYEKKYGTAIEREARREAQALARVKAIAERESIERDEQKLLMEVIKASLAEVCTVDQHVKNSATHCALHPTAVAYLPRWLMLRLTLPPAFGRRRLVPLQSRLRPCRCHRPSPLPRRVSAHIFLTTRIGGAAPGLWRCSWRRRGRCY